jgi:hypothetical protein
VAGRGALIYRGYDLTEERFRDLWLCQLHLLTEEIAMRQRGSVLRNSQKWRNAIPTFKGRVILR